MAVDRSHEAQNDAERERLRALVRRLSDADLARPMPGGWTIAASLAHAAYWDARAIFWIETWGPGGTPSSHEPENVGGPPFNLARAIHRKEHLDEIEQALAG